MASNIKVDIVRPTATNGSLSLKGDSGGSATTNGVTVNSSGNTSITGTTTVSSLVATTADINGGTIDSADITVGSGKTLDVSAGTLTLANDQISGDKVEGGTIAATTITALTSTTIKATTGQSLTIKDEDGNAAITIGTNNTAAGYLGLNFGSYHGDSGVTGSGTLTANTLDDYEEGTWTPTLLGSITNPTQSYQSGSTKGRYVKIGRLVVGDFIITMAASGIISGVGDATLGGLPFTLNSNTNLNGASMYSVNWNSTNKGAPIGIYGVQGTTTAFFRVINSYPGSKQSSGVSTASAADVTNFTIVSCSFAYEVA